jgi:hypothetical protein
VTVFPLREALDRLVSGASLALLVALSVVAPAQGQLHLGPNPLPWRPDSPVISLKSRAFVPYRGLDPSIRDALVERPSERRHVLVQFLDKMSHTRYSEGLATAGVQLLGYVSPRVWLSSIDHRLTDFGLATLGIRAVAPYIAEDRVDPVLRAKGASPSSIDRDGNVLVSVIVFRDVLDADAIRILGNYGRILSGPHMLHDWVISLPPSNLATLFQEDAIEWVEALPTPTDLSNGLRYNLRVDPLHACSFSLMGSGIDIGTWESGHAEDAALGNAQPGHDDFYDATGGGSTRIHSQQGAVTPHGTWVAGILMGTGFSSDKYGNGGAIGQWKGVAPRAEIFAYTSCFPPNCVPPELETPADEHNGAIANGIDVSNNSWGISDAGFGQYDANSRRYDEIVRGVFHDRKLPVVFAAGNCQQGPAPGPCVNAPAGPWRTINRGGQSSKNTITVGAIESDTDAIASFSSLGPVADGRLKPDCVASGDESTSERGIRSTVSGAGDFYEPEAFDGVNGNLRGTSFACPAVTGTLALLIQDYRARYGGADPLPSTVKALLLCSARDLGNPGPDFKYGYGAVDAYETINSLRNRLVIEDQVATTELDEFDFFVPPNTAKIRVQLVWDDPPGNPPVPTALINDLDLTLAEPNFGTWNAWILNPTPGSENNNATRGYDRLNNVEQVEVLNPAGGVWTIQVNGWNVGVSSPQKYSICTRTFPAISAEAINLFNDCFPVNSTSKVPTAVMPNGFDTTAALVRTGLNTSQCTGAGGVNGRHNVPGDSAIVLAEGSNTRVDLVFRILPGVGNYVTIGNRASGLVHRPATADAARSAAGNVSTAGDTSFWGRYMADNGAVGTGANGATGPGHTGNLGATSGWDANRWNSARCDTVEGNLFPRTSFEPNTGELTPSLYCSQYHESDPKFLQLGIRKTRCVLQPKSSPPELVRDQRFIRCGQALPPGFQGSDPDYPGAEYAAPQAGMAPNETGNPASVGRSGPQGNRGETYEYTKIIPDGLLTPGSHVQYFFRRSSASNPLVSVSLMPDTNYIVPQYGEGKNLDGHRWQQFGVLPDRWKDNAFPYGGTGMATMLVVDMDDGSGEERALVAIADTIGLTQSSRWGAHNGWKAQRGQDIYDVNVGGNDENCVRAHVGQAGSKYDLYQIRGGQYLSAAGHLGSRSANEANPGFETGKFSRHGPSEDMLLNYYRHILLLGGSLGCVALGPQTDLTDNDKVLLTSFLATGPGQPRTPQPRGVHALGNNLVEGQTYCGSPAFFQNLFLASLRNGDYLNFNFNGYADLLPQPPVSPASRVYWVANGATASNDVFNPEPGGQVGARYEDVFGQGPYVAGVYAPENGPRLFRTLVEGWRIGSTIGSRFTLSRIGMHEYWCDLMGTVFGQLVGFTCQSIIGVGDDPASSRRFANFLALRSDNPMRSGEARIVFGLEKSEGVEVRIYDVAGRLVRTLARRTFEGGREHQLTWDGTTENGELARNGVYLYRLRTPTWESHKKVTLLRK